jgi:hypothetical protein
VESGELDQGLVEVGPDVGGMFETDRDPNRPFADTRLLESSCIELPMGSARRVEDECLYSTEGRGELGQPYPAHDGAAGLSAAGEVKGEHSAAIGKDLFCQPEARVIGEAGPVHG